MPIANTPTTVPVIVDEDKCIADKGCTVCVDVCPLDVLRISDLTASSSIRRCSDPTNAVTVNIPYLLR